VSALTLDLNGTYHALGLLIVAVIIALWQ